MTDKEKIAVLEKENKELKIDLGFYKGIVDQVEIMIHISEIVDSKYFKTIWANNNYRGVNLITLIFV